MKKSKRDSNATRSKSHPEKPSQILNLPTELKLLIIQLLSHEDKKTISFISKSYRQLALPMLFGKLNPRYNLKDAIAALNQARGDVKAAIR
jgi:hypothetical protein